MYSVDQKIKDLISVASITSTNISPDGSEVLYTVCSPNNDYSEYVETLHLARNDAQKTLNIRIEGIQNVSSPQWSPSGLYFAALANGEICVFHSVNLELTAKLKIDGSISTFRWGVDDSSLWIMSTNIMDVNPNAPITVGKFSAPTSIWAVDVLSGKTEKLAEENEGMVIDICRSEDGEKLFYAHKADDIYDAANRVNVIDLNTKSNTVLIDEGKISVVNFIGCLANNRVVFAGLDIDPHNASYPKHYYSISADSGKLEKVWVPLNFRGTGMEARTFNNGQKILFREADGSNVLLYILENGAPHNIVALEKCITCISINNSGEIAFVRQDFKEAPEVYISDVYELLSKCEPQKISNINESKKDRFIPKVQIIRWESHDKKMVEGILIYPKDYQPEKKYPLLTLTTGRSNVFPRAYLGSPDTLAGRDRLPYPLALLAENGYMILCANCRSSDYHYYEFQCETSNETVDGYCKNVLAGIDFVVSLGIVDQEKLGVMGWSLGGYLVARLITWPNNNFRVAAIGNGITDFVSMYACSNCFEFQAFMRGGFWQSDETFKKFTKASPIRYISNTQAAVLIQHGTKNPSIPVSQGRELYYALRLAGKTVKMTEYPSASNTFNDPQYNIYSTNEVLKWMMEQMSI